MSISFIRSKILNYFNVIVLSKVIDETQCSALFENGIVSLLYDFISLIVSDVTLGITGICRTCVCHDITQIKYLELLVFYLRKYCVYGSVVAVKFNWKFSISQNKSVDFWTSQILDKRKKVNVATHAISQFLFEKFFINRTLSIFN